MSSRCRSSWRRDAAGCRARRTPGRSPPSPNRARNLRRGSTSPLRNRVSLGRARWSGATGAERAASGSTSCDARLHMAGHLVRHALGGERQATVVENRRQAIARHAGLDGEERTKLCVAILPDDEDLLVRVEELPDRRAKGERFDSHVVDFYTLGGERTTRLEHRRVRAAERNE